MNFSCYSAETIESYRRHKERLSAPVTARSKGRVGKSAPFDKYIQIAGKLMEKVSIAQQSVIYQYGHAGPSL